LVRTWLLRITRIVPGMHPHGFLEKASDLFNDQYRRNHGIAQMTKITNVPPEPV
jgi:hypothetical protein